MTKIYLGDDATAVTAKAFDVGRKNDSKTKGTSVVLNRDVEGGKSGETVKVSDDRANWLIANGFATKPENYVDQYAEAKARFYPAKEPPAPGGGA